MESIKKEVLEHYKKLYDRIIFLDNEIGTNIKEYDVLPPLVRDNKDGNGIEIIHDKVLVDNEIFIKSNGLVLKFSYGNWHNKKYKYTEITIYKDKDYNGEDNSSIKDLLIKVKEYINNNSNMIYNKIRKTIYNEDYRKNHKVDYNLIDLFDIKYVTRMDLYGLEVSNMDMDEIKSFTNITSIYMRNCYINDDVLFPSIKYYHLANTSIKSINSFLNIKGESLILESCNFREKQSISGSINYKSIYFNNEENIDELFLIMNRFNYLKDIELINDEFLKSFFANLSPAMTSLETAKFNSYIDNYDFLYKLRTLKHFDGKFRLKSDDFENIKKNRKKQIDNYSSNSNFSLNDYLNIQKQFTELNHHNFFGKIMVPSVALEKWKDIINSSDIETIRKTIIEISIMPSKIRKEIGTERYVTFVDTDLSKAYELLGIKLITDNNDKEFSSKYIVGLFGNNLSLGRKDHFGYINQPVYDKDEKILEIIKYRDEKEVTIKKDNEKIICEEGIINDINLHNYYSRKNNNESKLKNTENNILNLLLESDVTRNITKKRVLQLKALDILERKINSDTAKIIETCEFSMFDELELKELIRTLEIDKVREFISNRDINFDEISNDIVIIFNYVIKKQDILSNLISLDSIIDIYISYYLNNLEKLDIDTCNSMYMDDINIFISNNNLEDKDKVFIKSLILYRQEKYLFDLNNDLHKLLLQKEYLEEAKSVTTIISWNEMFHEGDDFDTLLNNGFINTEEYKLINDYIKLLDDIKIIKNKLNFRKKDIFSTYLSLIPSINELTYSDLKKIKENIEICDDNIDSFEKIFNQIYIYITNSYPKWIDLDLNKIEISKNKITTTSTRNNYTEYKKVLKKSMCIEKCDIPFQ